MSDLTASTVLKWQGGSKVMMLTPEGVTDSSGAFVGNMILKGTFSDGTQLRITCNPKLFPFARPGVQLFGNLVLCMAEPEVPEFVPPMLIKKGLDS